VEIGMEAAQFPEKKYIKEVFVAVRMELILDGQVIKKYK
jgi:hypothetical protein